jgi:dUTP pyrophosphatase
MPSCLPQIPKLLFVRKTPNLIFPMPRKATTGSAGIDFHACLLNPIVIKPGMTATIPLGWAVVIPVGYEGEMRPRSGLATKHGVTIINSPGTIDLDYRGELMCTLINHGKHPYILNPNDRICQMLVNKVMYLDLKEVDQFHDETERGEGGHGSTGR